MLQESLIGSLVNLRVLLLCLINDAKLSIFLFINLVCLSANIRKNGRSPAKIPLYSVYNPSISLGLQREDRQIDKNS